MLTLCLGLIAVAFAVAAPMTALARVLGRRLNAMDSAGVTGQVKAAARRVPNTGGVGIAWTILGLTLAGLGLVWIFGGEAGGAALPSWLEPLREHLAGLRGQTPSALWLLGGVLVLHVMGLIDDRKPLPAAPKLLVMLGVAAAVVCFTDSRLLTLLDARVGGAWLSVAVSVVWIVVVTNAFNFLDNMDGLSGGCAVVCGGFFLTAALVQPTPQWFVAGMLALTIGATLGFLVFNYPATPRRSASVFMGDGGSLVLGFLLAVLSIRITYVDAGSNLHATLTPLVILAIPLYDFCSVTAIRLSQGKSPFVGDLQHFSHRLVKRGLSKRAAVVVIHGCTAVTAIGGVSLSSLAPWQAVLVGVQTLLVVGVLALYEWSHAGGQAGAITRTPGRDAGELSEKGKTDHA